MSEKYATPEISYILWGKDASGMPSVTSDLEPSVSCDKHFWNTQGFSDSNRNALMKIRGLGAGRDLICVKNGRFESSFTIEALLTDDENPWELILGKLTTKTAEPNNTIPYFAVEIGYKDYSGAMKRVKFYGCKVNSASLSWSKSGDPIKVSLDIFAQRYWINETLQTPTAQSKCSFVGYESILKFGGEELAGIQDITFDIANGLRKIEDTRSRFITGLKEGQREFNLSGSVKYSTGTSNSSIAVQQAFMGNSEKIEGSAVPVGKDLNIEFKQTSNSKVTINFPAGNFYVEDCSAPIDVGGEEVVMKFSGFSKSLTSVAVVNS